MSPDRPPPLPKVDVLGKGLEIRRPSRTLHLQNCRVAFEHVVVTVEAEERVLGLDGVVLFCNCSMEQNLQECEDGPLQHSAVTYSLSFKQFARQSKLILVRCPGQNLNDRKASRY